MEFLFSLFAFFYFVRGIDGSATIRNIVSIVATILFGVFAVLSYKG